MASLILNNSLVCFFPPPKMATDDDDLLLHRSASLSPSVSFTESVKKHTELSFSLNHIP